MAGPALLAVPAWWAARWAAQQVGRAIISRGAQQAAAGAGAAVVLNEAVQQADEGAEDDLEGTRAVSITCATCADNPCAHLATGQPGPFRGGAHGAMQEPGGRVQSHHMPTQRAFRGTGLHPNVAPAIQMEWNDHRALRSSSAGSPNYNAMVAGQITRIQAGDFLGAQELGLSELSPAMQARYADAYQQMRRYTECLRQHGIIQ